MSVLRAGAAIVAVAAMAALASPVSAQSTYSADQLEAILKPTPAPTDGLSKTRAVKFKIGSKEEQAETTPPAGEPGSGRLPNLPLFFDFNSAELLPESTQQLDQLAQAMQRNALMTFRFRVAGHTDASGSEQYNQQLSERRARAVVDYLEAKGIAGDRLTPEGLGETDLADSANPDSATNRRVEIITLQ